MTLGLKLLNKFLLPLSQSKLPEVSSSCSECPSLVICSCISFDEICYSVFGLFRDHNFGGTTSLRASYCTVENTECHTYMYVPSIITG